MKQAPRFFALLGVIVVAAVFRLLPPPPNCTPIGVMALSDYEYGNLAELTLCYAVAIPFFQNSFSGDLFFPAVFFGALRLAERRFVWMQELPSTATST